MRALPPEPVSDLRVELEAARDSVAGFPIWIAVTVSNAARDMIESRLPSISRVGSIAIRIVVRSERGTIELTPPDASGCHCPPPGYTLAPGDARTFLLDLADVCPELEAGDHELTIAVPGRRAIGRVALRLLAPTEAERALAVELRSEDGWLSSMVLASGEPSVCWSALPARLRSPISMYSVLRRATWAARLADVPLALLRGFTGLLEAEAAALTYEIATANRDPSAAALRRDTAARWPTLAWRLDEIDGGDGLLAALRDLRELTA